MVTITVKKKTDISTANAVKLKTGTTLKTTTDPKIEKLRSQVDEALILYGKIESGKQTVKDYNTLKAVILSSVEEDYSDSEVIQVSGTKGQLKWSSKSDKRTVKDMKALHEKLGDEAFYAIITVSMSSVDKYLTAAEKEDLIDTEKTGSRSLTVIPNTL